MKVDMYIIIYVHSHKAQKSYDIICAHAMLVVVVVVIAVAAAGFLTQFTDRLPVDREYVKLTKPKHTHTHLHSAPQFLCLFSFVPCFENITSYRLKALCPIQEEEAGGEES